MAVTAFASGDINEKLKQWALWSRGDGLGAARLKKGNAVIPDITEVEAVVMEQCVLALKLDGDWREYEVICRHHQRGRSLGEIAIELGYSRATVRAIYDNARCGLNRSLPWAFRALRGELENSC